jgi:hypothetical protein
LQIFMVRDLQPAPEIAGQILILPGCVLRTALGISAFVSWVPAGDPT